MPRIEPGDDNVASMAAGRVREVRFVRHVGVSPLFDRRLPLPRSRVAVRPEMHAQAVHRDGFQRGPRPVQVLPGGEADRRDPLLSDRTLSRRQVDANVVRLDVLASHRIGQRSLAQPRRNTHHEQPSDRFRPRRLRQRRSSRRRPLRGRQAPTRLSPRIRGSVRRRFAPSSW
mgnify:CR=1 FL=1|jgi:hypothetical protein